MQATCATQSLLGDCCSPAHGFPAAGPGALISSANNPLWMFETEVYILMNADLVFLDNCLRSRQLSPLSPASVLMNADLAFLDNCLRSQQKSLPHLPPLTGCHGSLTVHLEPRINDRMTMNRLFLRKVSTFPPLSFPLDIHTSTTLTHSDDLGFDVKHCGLVVL